MKKLFPVLLAAALGCSWVPLSEGGAGVRVFAQGAPESCEKLGQTRARTATRALLFARNPRKIGEELDALARNEAARAGGDAVAPLGPPLEGERLYAIYRCPL